MCVAVFDQVRSRQLGRSGQDGATPEHVVVAVLVQSSSWQLGRCGQCGAIPEHILIAHSGQRLGGQQQAARVGQVTITLDNSLKQEAVSEGVVVAKFSSSSRLMMLPYTL